MIGLLSDAHGNLAAFTRGVDLLRARGAERIYFLGDAVGYIPSIAVLERLHADQIPCLQGNHEAMMLSRRFPPEREPAYRLGEIGQMLPRDLLRWVKEWPTSRVVPVAGGVALLVHGSPKDPTFDYVYPDSDLSQFTPSGERGENIRAVFMGNTHRPFIRDFGEIRFVNIGSCGMPRDDGGWASVCLYDENQNAAQILRYPIDDTIQELRTRHPDLHPAVLDVFARRSEGTPYGEICH
jgi:predicted phosphodiesterase